MLSGLSRLCGTRASPQALSRARHAFQSQQGRSLTQANALNYPRPLVVEPSAPHTATVIMLHGLGDTGAGWYAIGPELSPALPHVKFVFPSAPTTYFTQLWDGDARYDIASLEDINQKEDSEGLYESLRYVEELVKSEMAAGVPSERVVVAGFSQGGAIALMMLRSQLKLAAVVGLSTYVPLRNEVPVVSDANKATPILMCHGDADQVVAYELGRASYAQLQGLGADVEFITYRGMGHSAVPSEINDILEFLQQQIK